MTPKDQNKTVQFRRIESPGPAWDAEISPIAGAGLFQRSGWAAVWKAAYGQRSWGILAGESDAEASGALLLVEKRSPLFGAYLISLPYFDASGPVAPNALLPGLHREER